MLKSVFAAGAVFILLAETAQAGQYPRNPANPNSWNPRYYSQFNPNRNSAINPNRSPTVNPNMNRELNPNYSRPRGYSSYSTPRLPAYGGRISHY